MRSGRVRVRAAEVVLPVAVGDAEALWVERAASLTVRELDERRQRVSYERLRVLSRLPEGAIARWIARALATTCIALRRAVDGELDRQLRARRKIVVPLPHRVAALLAAALHTVRERLGRALAPGTCLAIIAAHYPHLEGLHAARPQPFAAGP